jgi:ubiquinone biosynthesis protein
MFRAVRNFSSLLRITLILRRHGVLFFWRGEATKEKGERLSRALHELGPTFIKLGQALSTRADLVGHEVSMALAELQDRLPPFPSSKAREIIAAQLGRPVEELFATFEDTPAAAASIAQVHFATLHTGDEVAVKILRPDIGKAFARDIELFYWLADLAQRFKPEWKRFRLPEVAHMFEEMVRFELDLRFEAAAATQLRENLKSDTGFYVPKVYWDTTAHQVMTLERIRGIPIGDVAALRAAGHDTAKLIDIAAVSVFKQVFRDGFFHADLHPGNLFVLPSGDIAAVDFGIMGRLDKQTRIYLAQIMHGFLSEDYHALAKVHFDAGLVPAHKSVDNFTLALMALNKPIAGRKLSDISVGRLLGQLFTTAEAFDMEVQPHLLLLQKNMVITEGVGRMLNPDVNMWLVAQPLIEAWVRENFGARARIQDHAQEAIALAKTLPSLLRQAEAALERVNSGGLKLHPDTQSSMQNARSSVHRDWLIFAWVALVVAAFIYLRQ